MVSGSDWWINFIKHLKNTLYTCKQPLMMAYERSKSTPDKVLSKSQIEQTVCKQMTDVKLWLLNTNTWNHLTVQKRAQAHLRILSTKFIHKSYIYLVYMYKQDLTLNNLQGLICHKTQLNETYIIHLIYSYLILFIIVTLNNECSSWYICLWNINMYILPNKCWLSSKDLYRSTLCGHWMQSRGLDRSNDQ